MPEERIHDHLVYQDIDLSKNKIKNIVALENTEYNAPTSISITANGDIPIKSNSNSGVISLTQGTTGAKVELDDLNDVSITKANRFLVERTSKSPATKFEIASDGNTSLTNAKDVSASGSGDISLKTYGGSASIQIPNDTHSIKLSKDNGTSFEIQSDNSVIIDKAKDFKSATGTGEIYFKTIGTQGEANSKNATIEVPSDGNITLKKTGSTQLQIKGDDDVVLTDAGNISADGSGDISVTSTGGNATLTVPDNKSITLKKYSSLEGKIEIDDKDNINLYANTITTTGSGDYGVSITDGDIDLSTTAGDIGVSTNDGNIGVSTTEGNIDVSTDDGIVSITAESDTADTSSVSIQRIDSSVSSSPKTSEINLNSDGSIDISSDNGSATIEVPSNKSITLKKTGSTELEIELDNDVTLTGARDISSTGSGNISVTSNGGDATITVPKAKSINLISKSGNDLGATLTLGGVESGTAHQNAVLTGADKIIASGAKDIEIKNDESGTSGVGGHLKIEKSSGDIELKGTGNVVIESNSTSNFSIIDGAPSIIGSSNALVEVPNTSTITIHQKDPNGASIGIDDSHNISLSGAKITETGTSDVIIQNDAESGAINGGHLKINKGTGDIELKSNATNGGLSFVNRHGDGIKLTNGASGILTVKAPGDISITNNDSTSGGYINITKSSGKVDIQSNGTNDASIILDEGKITGVGENDIRIGNDKNNLASGGYLEIKNSDSSDATLKSKGNVFIGSTTGTLTEKANGNITVESTTGTLTEKAFGDIEISNQSKDSNDNATGGGYLKITSGASSTATLKAFKNFDIEGANGKVELSNGKLTANGNSVEIDANPGTLDLKGSGKVTLNSTGDSVSIEAKTSGKSITLDSPNISLKSGNGNSDITIKGTNNLQIQSGDSESSVTSDKVTAKKGATVETGGITVEAGGIKVQSGGANITGNSKVTGDLEVTGVTTLNSQVRVYWNDTTKSLVFEKVAN